jgi:ankyrin repeat protein
MLSNQRDLLPKIDALLLFYYAVRSGNLPRAIQCLDEKHVDVNGCYQGQSPFLILASACSHPKMVKLLLDRGANPSIRAADNNFALKEAAMNGNAEIITLLCEAKANVNAINNDHATALLSAVQNGHEDAVKALLLFKPNPFITSTRSLNNPFTAAQVHGQDRILTLLLDYCAGRHQEPEYNIEVVLNVFARAPEDLRTKAYSIYIDCLRNQPAGENAVANFNALINAQNRRDQTKAAAALLLNGAMNANIDEMKKALATGLSVDHRHETSLNRTALMIVLSNSGDLAAVNFLLDNGADPDLLDEKDEPLWKTPVSIGHIKPAIALIQRSKNPHQTTKHKGASLLRYSLEFNTMDIWNACTERRISPFTSSILHFTIRYKKDQYYSPLATYMASFYQDSDPAGAPKAVLEAIVTEEAQFKPVNLCGLYVKALLKLKGAVNLLARANLTDEAFKKMTLSTEGLLAAIDGIEDPAEKLAAYEYALDSEQPNFFNRLIQRNKPLLGLASTLSRITSLRLTLLSKNSHLESKIVNAKDTLILLEAAIKTDDNLSINLQLERLAELFLMTNDKQIEVQLEALDNKYKLALHEQFKFSVEVMRSEIAATVPPNQINASAPPASLSAPNSVAVALAPSARPYAATQFAFLPPPPAYTERQVTQPPPQSPYAGAAAASLLSPPPPPYQPPAPGSVYYSYSNNK